MDSRVPDLPGHVVPVDVRLLQEHVQAPLVLRQRVAGDPAKEGSKGEGSDARGKISPFDVSLVDEPLQAGPPLLDEPLLVDAVVVPEGQLALQGLARQRGDHDLRRTFTMNSVPNAKKTG